MLDVLLACLIPFLVISFVLAFVAAFVVLVRLILRSQAGTRSQLKLIYGCAESPEHQTWHASEANFGRVGIPVALAASPGGLWLRLPLRWGGTPEQLLIPWPDVSLSDARFFGLPRKRLRFLRVPSFHLDLDPQALPQLPLEHRP